MLLSPSIDAVLHYAVRFSVPKYENSWDAYPQEVRQKRYDLALFELFPRRVPLEHFEVDVGRNDLLRLREFHEQAIPDDTGMTLRWTRERSLSRSPASRRNAAS